MNKNLLCSLSLFFSPISFSYLCVCYDLDRPWQAFLVSLGFLVLFCGLVPPVGCQTCFLFYFEGPSCPHLFQLLFPPVHLPGCLHLPLVCPSVYLSPVFPFLFAGPSCHLIAVFLCDPLCFEQSLPEVFGFWIFVVQ